MSVKIMAAIFESETLGPTERLIMLALADHADDAGRCYPSMSRLCKRTGLGERAIQTNIKALVAKGYVTIIPNAGQGLANLYFVRATPAADAPPQEMHPRRKCAPTPASAAETPAADAPKPSGTIIGTVNREAIASPADKDAAAAVDVYNAAAARSGWSKVQRMSKPRLSALKARLKEAGGLPGWLAALERAEASDFLCGRRPGRDGPFFASFDFLTQASSFTRLMEGNYDNRTAQHRASPASHLPENRPDPALANIARIVGLGTAPSHGGG